MQRLISLLLGVVCLYACASSDEEQAFDDSTNHRFQLLTEQQTGIDFANILTEGLNTNVLLYEYFYNGGGVAVGDLNNDGLEDIYFTGNMVPNKLYLNKGNLQFEDITTQSNAEGRSTPWKTGVTMADVNGDGLLDIYVCYSGNVSEESLRNQLFINLGPNQDGIPQFEDKAVQYSLADPTYSTQAAFFDYDRDGDLDMFLLNHNPHSLPILDESSTAAMLAQEDKRVGVRLYRHDTKQGEPYFIDVTTQAGLKSSALTYGLGIGIADLNQDGWPDLYICNDYSVPDFLYLNNQNGTFKDATDIAIGHTSHSSMGNDIADFNNDGLLDIYTLDMLPEDNRRQKLLTGLDNYELFDFNLKMGYRHQYMRNMLQVNQGIQEQKVPVFSELGQLSGISNTDWSWAALFADLDNDGWKDLLVTNGNLRDFTNLDFVKYMGDHLKRIDGKVKREDVLELVYKMPSSNMKNYLFHNQQDLTFTNVADAWGLSQIANSGGAAYADLDNDGDLDLVINNVNLPAFVYQNKSNELATQNNYLKVQLKGEGKNTAGIGAVVHLYQRENHQMLEQMPSRGYQSSVSPILHFGLGQLANIDSLVVTWPTGKKQTLVAPKANELVLVHEKDSKEAAPIKRSTETYFKSATSAIKMTTTTQKINDFKRQPLLVNALSTVGPILVKGDYNNDGIEDVFVGKKQGEVAQLYKGLPNGHFSLVSTKAFEADKECTDADAVFVDVNQDGHVDLIVASGGYSSYAPDDERLRSRVYLNNGKGEFIKLPDAFDGVLNSASCLAVHDINGDGYPDLFLGGRVVPGSYPETPKSYVLINDKTGRFADQTATIAPELSTIGMVTDALFVDLDQDKQQELVLVGEWMPVSIFTTKASKWTNSTSQYFERPMTGWWNVIEVADVNADGKVDLVVGNMGLNTQATATEQLPAEMLYKDFDDNGSVDPILSFAIQGKMYPYVTRDEMLDQMSIMRPRFPSYEKYADATIKDIFTPAELENSKLLRANTLATSVFLSQPNGVYTYQPLPLLAQSSPIFTINVVDVDKDGHQDLLLCGNLERARLRFGKYDANYGLVLKGDSKGNFVPMAQQNTGLLLRGDVRSSLVIGSKIWFGIHQSGITHYQF